MDRIWMKDKIQVKNRARIWKMMGKKSGCNVPPLIPEKALTEKCRSLKLHVDLKLTPALLMFQKPSISASPRQETEQMRAMHAVWYIVPRVPPGWADQVEYPHSGSKGIMIHHQMWLWWIIARGVQTRPALIPNQETDEQVADVDKRLLRTSSWWIGQGQVHRIGWES
jgi:hypothetical protein